LGREDLYRCTCEGTEASQLVEPRTLCRECRGVSECKRAQLMNFKG
jgi:hypothetical protein